MSKQKPCVKSIAVLKGHTILMDDDFYYRLQWPTVVEWWLLYGETCNSAQKVTDRKAVKLEKVFQELSK